MADLTPPPIPAVNPTVPPVSVPPTPIPVGAVDGYSNRGSMVWIIVAAFVVVAILVGVGIFMYLRIKQTNPAFQQISQNVQESINKTGDDLSSIKIDDVSADFSGVDKDLNNLQ